MRVLVAGQNGGLLLLSFCVTILLPVALSHMPFFLVRYLHTPGGSDVGTLASGLADVDSTNSGVLENNKSQN